MRNPITWCIAGLLFLLIDFYFFQSIKVVTQTTSNKTKVFVYTLYWTITALTFCFFLAIPYFKTLQTSKLFRNYVFAILIGIFLSKLLGSLFFLVDDARRLMIWVYRQVFQTTNKETVMPFSTNTLSRSAFLSWLGIGIGGTLFGMLLYGFSNKYNYKITKVPMKFPHLPDAFRGFKIVHISDIHSGSLQDPKGVEHGVNMILQQNPDMILFTGDLVNDRYEEMKDYQSIFSKLKAPFGVFSTLGNHDYGDYAVWPSAEEKKRNLENFKKVHAEMGWRLLMNEHVPIQKNGESIALLGIENWGAKGNFPKYGKMSEAIKGTEKYPFKILMSHDPSHWDAEIKTTYPDIDIMLAGHTHGMQFGIENPYFKWSPVQWMYKQWAGMYKDKHQVLYVNRGFGFIGYPGRVGILPEITVIELV